MYCENCGNELEENVVFCSKCGTKVEDKEAHVSKRKVLWIVFAVLMALLATLIVGVTVHLALSGKKEIEIESIESYYMGGVISARGEVDAKEGIVKWGYDETPVRLKYEEVEENVIECCYLDEETGENIPISRWEIAENALCYDTYNEKTGEWHPYSKLEIEGDTFYSYGWNSGYDEEAGEWYPIGKLEVEWDAFYSYEYDETTDMYTNRTRTDMTWKDKKSMTMKEMMGEGMIINTTGKILSEEDAIKVYIRGTLLFLDMNEVGDLLSMS